MRAFTHTRAEASRIEGRAREARLPNRPRAAAPHGRSFRALQKKVRLHGPDGLPPTGLKFNLIKAPPSQPKPVRGSSGAKAWSSGRALAVVLWRKGDKNSSTRTGRAKPVTRARRRLRRVGLTSKMSCRPRRGNGRSSSWVAAVASVSAGADQPERARRGGKEAAEVACADRDEGASED